MNNPLRFFDPEKNKDGSLYAPKRYQDIVKESYLISKNSGSSYNDVLKITPLERGYILDIIAKEVKDTNDAINASKAQQR